MNFVKIEDVRAEDMQTIRYLTFHIGEAILGIDMHYIAEIISIQKIRKLPDMPDYMKGIINLRCKIIPILDGRLLFGKEAKKYDDKTCIIIIEIKGTPVGLIVDSVTEIVSIAKSDVSDLPKANKAQNSRFVKSIAKLESDTVRLLDCDKLFDDEEIETIIELSLALGLLVC